MRTIILYVFYIISLSLINSQVLAYSSADFNDDQYGSSWGFETTTTANNYYPEKKQRAERLAENKSYDPRHFASNQIRKTYTKTKITSIHKSHSSSSYGSRLSQTSVYGEKVIIVNPRKHVWGAYSADGKLLRSGLATAGSSWCPDIHRACRTRSGTFRIYTLGNRSCYSKRYPVGKGGAPMPYCMFFNGNQGLHGSREIAEANLSHGCVRISVSDAEWVRYNFATIGTKVIVTPY
jgi:hypothetical protein